MLSPRRVMELPCVVHGTSLDMLIYGVHGEAGDSAVVSKSGSDELADRNLFPVLLRVPEIVLHLLLQPAFRTAAEGLR